MPCVHFRVVQRLAHMTLITVRTFSSSSFWSCLSTSLRFCRKSSIPGGDEPIPTRERKKSQSELAFKHTHTHASIIHFLTIPSSYMDSIIHTCVAQAPYMRRVGYYAPGEQPRCLLQAHSPLSRPRKETAKLGKQLSFVVFFPKVRRDGT